MPARPIDPHAYSNLGRKTGRGRVAVRIFPPLTNDPLGTAEGTEGMRCPVCDKRPTTVEPDLPQV